MLIKALVSMSVDVVVRPEDIKMVSYEEGMLKGEVQSVIFKGVHYEMTVESNGIKWIVHSTTMESPGSQVGLNIHPPDIHIMKKVDGL